MPLDLKNEPPYYTIDTTSPTQNQTYNRLDTKLTTTSNVSTTLTTLQTITIPANTLTTNGDILEATFTFQMAGGAAIKNITVTFNGTNYTTNNIVQSGCMLLKIQTMRLDSTNMGGSYEFIQNGTIGELSLETLSGFTFTNPFTIEIKGQGTASNQVNLICSYINLIKN